MYSVTPKRITPEAENLLSVLSHKEWLSRSEIAERLGKKRLNVWTINLLHMLEEKQLIVAFKKPGFSRDGYIWQYKLSNKSEVASVR